MCFNPGPELTNDKGDQLNDADKNFLTRIADPARKSEILMNWLVGQKPKPINPGEEFARSEKMAGVVARADAGKGMSGLFGAGLLVGDTAPNLNLPVGQPGKDPGPIPLINLTPEVAQHSPTSGEGNKPGTGPVGSTPGTPKAPWTPGVGP